MNNILNLLWYIVRPNGLFWDLVTEAEDAHRRITRVIFFLSGVIIFAFFFNWIGWEELNIIIALLMNLGFLIIGSNPRFLVLVGAIGVANTSEKKWDQEAKDFWKKWFVFLSHVLLWLSIILLVLGTIPVSNNPWSVMLILLTLIIFGWMDTAWKLEFKKGRKIAYWYTVGVIIVAFLMLVPQPIYIKHIGWYPFDVLKISETEAVLTQIEQIQKRNEDHYQAISLEKIRKKLEGGEPYSKLSQEEKATVDKTKQVSTVKKGITYIGKGVNTAINKIGKILKRDENKSNKPEVNSTYLRRGDVLKYNLAKNDATPWITVPAGVIYNIHPRKGIPYRVYYWNGKVVDIESGNKGLPDVYPTKFKVINIGSKQEIYVISGI